MILPNPAWTAALALAALMALSAPVQTQPLPDDDTLKQWLANPIDRETIEFEHEPVALRTEQPNPAAPVRYVLPIRKPAWIVVRRHPRGHRGRRREVIVDPGYRRARGNIFPRIQDAIDAVRPGGTVIVRPVAGYSGKDRGGPITPRTHVYMEHLTITKPLTLKGADATLPSRLSSGPDGRCLTIAAGRHGAAPVIVSDLEWFEPEFREPSTAPCIDIHQGTVVIADSRITWPGVRPAVNVGEDARVTLERVTISTEAGQAPAVRLRDGGLTLARSSVTGNPHSPAVDLGAGLWTLDGNDIRQGGTGVRIAVLHHMRGRLTGNRITGFETGIDARSAGGPQHIPASFEVSGNVLSGNGRGARFANVSGVTFRGNRVNGNAQAGLSLERSIGTFTNNVMQDNAAAVELGPAPRWSAPGTVNLPLVAENAIKGRRSSYGIVARDGGAGILTRNRIEVRRCRCLAGDLDHDGLLIRQSQCLREMRSRACRRVLRKNRREAARMQEAPIEPSPLPEDPASPLPEPADPLPLTKDGTVLSAEAVKE